MPLFLERLYGTIMGNYIRKDELTKDTDDELFSNAFYYPGLVYIKGKGYIITNSNYNFCRNAKPKTISF